MFTLEGKSTYTTTNYTVWGENDEEYLVKNEVSETGYEAWSVVTEEGEELDENSELGQNLIHFCISQATVPDQVNGYGK